MKYVWLVLLVLPMLASAQRDTTFDELNRKLRALPHPDSPYIDPFPKWVRDTLPKPMVYGTMKDGFCFCFDLRDTNWIMVGPDAKTGCFEIWALKDWKRLDKIWAAYNDAGHYDRIWICTCNY